MMSEERGIWIITDEATAQEGGKSGIDTGADYESGERNGRKRSRLSAEDLKQNMGEFLDVDVVIIYDACRDEARAKGLGFGEEEQKGVITLASCSPQERSYEIDVPEIQQGSFTYALIESLENTQLGRGNYATFDRLYQRLRYRVPEINRQYGKPEKQHPYGFVEPDEKRYCILLPQRATTQDIETYKKQALNAEIRQYYNRVIVKKAAQIPQEEEAIPQVDILEKKLPKSLSKIEPVSQSKLPRSKAYWLFQGNPKCYRMLDAIRDLEEMPWPLNRYKKDIAVGDEVLIWVSGKLDYWIDTNLLKIRMKSNSKVKGVLTTLNFVTY